MINVQDIITNIPDILEGVSKLAGIFAAVIGGVCALKGIGYLEALRQRKAVATFSFESQLYARLHELQTLLSNNERLLTNLYSERDEWGDTRAASEKETNQFYNCVLETFNFIKNASDQMPAYESWVDDYTELIQFLSDIIHFDIRDSKNGFKYTKKCGMDARNKLCKSICFMLNRLMDGIKKDQKTTAKELFNYETTELNSVS